jgi:hypothetical protein
MAGNGCLRRFAHKNEGIWKAGEGTIRLEPCLRNQDSNALADCSTRTFNLQYEDKNRVLASRSIA